MNEKIEFIEGLIKLTEENDLSELSIDFKGFKVAIKKNCPQPVQQTMFVGSAPAMAVPATQTTGEEAAPAADAIPSNYIPVKSPLAGVFYRAPKPGSPPFANVGDMVEKDQVLCIIEAMKIMNEITSEHKAKVAKICIENGEVANEGDLLFYLEPAE